MIGVGDTSKTNAIFFINVKLIIYSMIIEIMESDLKILSRNKS